MAISVTDRKVTHVGNGATTRWPLTFPVLQASHISVIITDAAGVDTQLLNNFKVDSTLTFVDYPVSGGTVLPTGWKITLVRTVPYTQETDLGARWPFESIEAMVDKNTMQVQQLAEEVSRSVKVGLTSSVTPDALIAEIRTGAATATTKAAEASTSATQAANSQAAAAASATQAATSAANAATDAVNNVATLLDGKVQAAETAKAQAETARTGAQTAQTAAEAAKTSIENYTRQIGSIAGSTNYIVDGMKITPGTGLQVNVSPGRASIGEKVVQLIQAWALSLDPRMAALLYQQQDGSIGKINAVNPLTFIDNNTVGMWIFNKTTAGANIPNSAVGISSIAVANDVVPTGGLSVTDGWNDYAIKGDGTSGCYQSQNNTGFPVGANERELNILFTPLRLGNVNNWQCFTAYGDFSNSAGFGLSNPVSNPNLAIWSYATNYDSGYALELGKTYLGTAQYDGTNEILLVNGSYVGKLAATLNTGAGNLIVFRNAGNEWSCAIIHFIELRNKMRTPAQLGAIANKLCLPCAYTGYSAEYPTISDADKATAWHEWKFDEATGNTVADSAGTLNGTATGGSIVDSDIGLGKARKLGGNGQYVSIGNYAFPSEWTMITVFKENSGVLSDKAIFANGDTSTNGNIINIRSSGNFEFRINNTATTYNLGTNAILNGINFLALSAKTGTITTYANSLQGVVVSASWNANSYPAFIGHSPNNGWGNAYDITASFDYFLIIPRALSQAEIAIIYNKLMQQKTRNIVDDMLPTNSISLGFARTDSSKVIEIVDSSDPKGKTPDYAYGIRVGALGDNKRKFLGFKGFSGPVPLKWENPFGTRKIKTYYKWAQDANGLNESDLDAGTLRSNYYFGLYRASTTTNPIAVIVAESGACYFNGAWQTSGCIGAYCEVID